MPALRVTNLSHLRDDLVSTRVIKVIRPRRSGRSSNSPELRSCCDALVSLRKILQRSGGCEVLALVTHSLPRTTAMPITCSLCTEVLKAEILSPCPADRRSRQICTGEGEKLKRKETSRRRDLGETMRRKKTHND